MRSKATQGSLVMAFTGLALAILLVGHGAAQSINGHGRQITNNTPPFVQKAQNIGPEDSSKLIEVTLWLHLNNQDTFHQLVRELYQKDSPRFHQWLTPAEFNSGFGPTAEGASAVQDFLTSHNLNVVSVGRNNLYVRARGTVGDVQRAFHVQIAKFNVAGKTYRANISDPVIDGPAGSFVAAISGLADLKFQPHSVRPTDPETNKPFPAVSLGGVGTDGLFQITMSCKDVDLTNRYLSG